MRFRQKCFLVNFATFLKKPLGCLLLHKDAFCLLSYHDLLPFQKRCQTYFPAECFLGLICRLGTRGSSIFRFLSQKLIFNPVEHLRWSNFAETVNSINKTEVKKNIRKAIKQHWEAISQIKLAVNYKTE